MELGFPNKLEFLIDSYAKTPSDLIETIYPYVPVKVIGEVIAKHGGLQSEPYQEEDIF